MKDEAEDTRDMGRHESSSPGAPAARYPFRREAVCVQGWRWFIEMT